MPIPRETTPAVDRTLLRDDVYRRLRDAIVDGTFLPGEQLRDAELAEWLGVSRTPVREALLRLAHGGLVEAQPGRSTRVTPLDQRAVLDARGVVAAMHELAAREAVPRMTQIDLDAMRDANRRFWSAIEEGDTEAVLKADDDLHGVLVTVSGNRALAAILEQFTAVLRRAELLRFTSLEGRSSVARHDELIRLCAAGDADGAAAVAFEIWHSLPISDESKGADNYGSAGPPRPPR